MKKTVTIDGNEAAAYTSYMFTELAGIYPITPASPMAEHIDEWSSENRQNIFNNPVKVVEMQSEAGAIGLVHGALSTGTLATTYTASQGLLLMLPNMYKIAGEMLPCVIHVAARSLSTHALSIMGDHQDIYACRGTGFAMIASSNVEDASYLSAISHLSTIEASIPFIHFFDGFRTSHELQKIEVLESDDYAKLINKEALNNFKNKALNINKPYTKGTAQNDDIYFQATEVRNKYYNQIPNIVNSYMEKINSIANTNYKPFNYYGDKEATKIIIAMGSVCETIKEVIDILNKQNNKLGLIEVHLYRPFSIEYLLDVLPNTVSKIAVLDRTKEPGSIGEPLYLDIKSAISNKEITVVGGRYGLSSKNVNPAQIKAVYDMLDNPVHNFTIGITDDLTNLSLPLQQFSIKNSNELLIYGYGSDGMVSASKSIIKLIGDNTNNYVQGYFQYDSKKSGGVTVSHLRFSENKIKSTYYVENPNMIVVTKDSYLKEYDILDNILENGTLIINTIKNEDEINKLLNNKNKKIINDKNITVYIVNAYLLATKLGLKNKISTIMQSIIINLSNLIDYEEAKQQMKKYAKNRYFKKGNDILEANYLAIDQAIESLTKIKIDNKYNEELTNSKTIIDLINIRKGNDLTTKDFLEIKDGSFPSFTTINEKRAISDKVPKWLNQNCITCNMCSLYCPHAVIRPFLLNQTEYDKADDYIKNKTIKPLEPELKDYYYIIGISVKDCTGCSLCISNCPGKKQDKALVFNDLNTSLTENEQEIFDYLISNVTDKGIDIKRFKDTQYKTPQFCFSGACAGCGETPYIKLLTQLFGDNMIVANATGCSSIYGASAPSMPYNIPWASSLFEDNAEYGYGMVISDIVNKNKIKNIMEKNMDNKNKELFNKWLNSNDYITSKEVYDNLDYNDLPHELNSLKEHLIKKSIWAIGGDGWAYDIGYSGIDHVLANNENINILVLDTEVYSNTGGQSSKSSRIGSIASFTTSGKKVTKKDLAKIALTYPHVYVGTINLSANPAQAMKTLLEAEKHDGPSIVIAYSPCISHGIKGGLENSTDNAKLATICGYFPLFRFNPSENKFYLDSKSPNFDLYESYLLSQSRYSMLKVINPNEAEQLLQLNKEEAIKRFNYYQDQERLLTR